MPAHRLLALGREKLLHRSHLLFELSLVPRPCRHLAADGFDLALEVAAAPAKQINIDTSSLLIRIVYHTHTIQHTLRT